MKKKLCVLLMIGLSIIICGCGPIDDDNIQDTVGVTTTFMIPMTETSTSSTTLKTTSTTQTTTSTTEGSKETLTTTVTTIEEPIEVETTVCQTIEEVIQTTTTTIATSLVTSTTTQSNGMELIKTFTRGTYYAYGNENTYGGSGRKLIDGSIGDGTVKGSVASSYILWYAGARLYGYDYYTWKNSLIYGAPYVTEGYNYNGKRTMVYISTGLSSVDGYYYLDDCDAGNPEVVDFFYYYNSNSPFCNQGVLTSVTVYLYAY